MVHVLENPKVLSDEAVENELGALCLKEREVTVELLGYLAEVDRRKLYASSGYSSLFSYCTHRLKYSESAANRRISSARALQRFPEATGMLITGALNLSTLSLAGRILNEENAAKLLKELSGRSIREVEEIVSEHQAKPLPVRERIKPIAVKKSVPSKDDPSLFAPMPVTLNQKPQNELRNRSGGSEADAPQPEPVIEKRFQLQFSLDQRGMERFKRVQALLSNRLPKGATIEATVEALMSDFLKRADPAEREKRRAHRKAKRPSLAKEKSVSSRQISIPVRDAVYQRDGGQCTYIGPDGRRCGSSRHLELDHIHPFATGGTNEPENLRLLCRGHNQLHGRESFGSAVMRNWMRRKAQL